MATSTQPKKLAPMVNRFNFLKHTLNIIQSSRLIVSFLIFSVLIRLYLSSDRDILALNQPYDDLWFVLSADRWVWGGTYHHLVFAQLPIYSIWLKGISLLGFPARFSIDLLWIGACGYLGYAVSSVCSRVWPGLVLFIYLEFHPYSIVLFDRALAETLTAALVTLAAAGFLDTWNQINGTSWHRTLAVTIACISFAAAYHCRKEGIVLLLPLIVLAILSIVQWQTWWSREYRSRKAIPLIVLPIVSIFFLGIVLAGANYVRWGVFARNELMAPEYQRAMNNLIAIDLGTPTPKMVTITACTRALAYTVSPTFAELKPFLDGAVGQEVARYTSQFTGIAGEIANGWFYWTLRDAAALAGWHRDARSAEAKYSAMADELEKAFKEGRLIRRTVLLPFIDPDWRKWLLNFPLSFLKECQLLISPDNATDIWSELVENATLEQMNVYYRIAGRRRMPYRAFLTGWINAPEGTSIGLGDSEKSFSWRDVAIGSNRSDVSSNAHQFMLTGDDGTKPTSLHVRLPNGQQGKLDLAILKQGQVYNVASFSNNVVVGIDGVSVESARHIVDLILKPIIIIWSIAGWILAVAGIFVLVYRLIVKQYVNHQELWFIVLLSFFAIIARCALFALLDVTSWSGLQARYLLPALPFFGLFGILSLTYLHSCLPLLRKGNYHNYLRSTQLKIQGRKTA